MKNKLIVTVIALFAFVASTIGQSRFIPPSNYSIDLTSSAQVNLANATTYYYGFYLTTVVTASKVAIPFTGRIIAAYSNFYVGGTVGSGETTTLFLRQNNTTDISIHSPVTFNNASHANFYSNTNLNIPVTAGDTIEMKILTPTFVTLPTVVVMHTQLILEK